MDLYGGIVFGLLAIIKIVEVIGHFVKKRELQSKKDKGYWYKPRRGEILVVAAKFNVRDNSPVGA